MCSLHPPDVKSFGVVEYDAKRNVWAVTCAPHVAIKLKGMFPRISKYDFGTLRLSATEENSRDLEWFLSRFPMDCGSDGFLLDERARAYDARSLLTSGILTGEYEAPDLQKMALPPRSYQEQTAVLVWNVGGVLCADELGLGKTVISLTMLTNPKTLPALIVCPTHLPDQWVRECKRFLPHLKTHVCKKGTPYSIGTPDVVILNYHKLAGWADVLAPYVRSVTFDECQEIRRVGSLKYDAAQHIAGSVEFRLGLSATPIYNYGGEFFNVMDCLAPGVLGSSEEFLREWCHGYSMDSQKARITDPKAFGSFLRESGRMVLRTKKEVGRELPALNHVFQDVDIDSAALEKIESAATELAGFIVDQNKRRGFDVMRASQEFSNTLRQATGIAKARFVASFVDMLLTDNEDQVVLFGWHREVYGLWADYLRRYRPAWFTGSESPSKKAKELKRFLDRDTRLLIMSLRSGSGVDGLQHVCSRVVIGELDWSPSATKQCVGRVYRDGQEEPVFAYYMVATGGADPFIADVNGMKRAQLEGVLDPYSELVVKSQVDPNHVRGLAEAYLKGRTVSSRVIPGGRLDKILSSAKPRVLWGKRGLQLKKGWK